MMSEKYITNTITASEQSTITLIVFENKRCVDDDDDDDDDCKIANYLNNNTDLGVTCVWKTKGGATSFKNQLLFTFTF